MSITVNCPKCGSRNITTAGSCANCGWGPSELMGKEYTITKEIEIKVCGDALINDYKRLLFENKGLQARIAELEEENAALKEERRWINNEPDVEGAYLVEAVMGGNYDYRVEWFLDGDWVELDKKYFSRYFNMLLIDNVDGTPQAPELPEVTNE